MQWTEHIRQRVKLRDLHILLAVAEHGSILRAAKHLAVSHPVVSRTISELELALGVRLFDRGARGVETTVYGRAAIDCGVAVFDELRRGMQHLEYLSDPTAGEVRIGATPPLMAGLIPAVIARVGRHHPRIFFIPWKGTPTRCTRPCGNGRSILSFHDADNLSSGMILLPKSCSTNNCSLWPGAAVRGQDVARSIYPSSPTSLGSCHCLTESLASTSWRVSTRVVCSRQERERCQIAFHTATSCCPPIVTLACYLARYCIFAPKNWQ